MNTQERRRDRRADKQKEWKRANPLLVGISAKPGKRPTLSLNSKRNSVNRAVNPLDLSDLFSYQEQIDKAAERIERRNNRIRYSKPSTDYGVNAVGRQKQRGKSIPAYYD